uniref:Uncharacterized protein n=1 Tax=Cacopsylla melanoneura TaxID=428564 RepID=A0A8D9AQY7_9HEMI
MPCPPHPPHPQPGTNKQHRQGDGYPISHGWRLPPIVPTPQQHKGCRAKYKNGSLHPRRNTTRCPSQSTPAPPVRTLAVQGLSYTGKVALYGPTEVTLGIPPGSVSWDTDRSRIHRGPQAQSPQHRSGWRTQGRTPQQALA